MFFSVSDLLFANDAEPFIPERICNLAINEGMCNLTYETIEQGDYRRSAKLLYSLWVTVPLQGEYLIDFSKHIIEMALLAEDTTIYLSMLSEVAIVFENSNRFDSANYYNEQVIAVLDSGYTDRDIYTFYNNIAYFNVMNNDFVKAEDRYLKAIETINLKNKRLANRHRAKLFMNLALMYCDLGYFGVAQNWLDTSLVLIEDRHVALKCTYHAVYADYLSQAYGFSNEMLQYMDSTIADCNQGIDLFAKAEVYKLYVTYYIRNDNYNKAKAYLDSLQVLTDYVGVDNVGTIYNKAAIMLYYNSGQYQKVIDVGSIMYPYGYEYGSIRELDYIDIISKSYFALNNFVKAYELQSIIYERYIELREKELVYAKTQIIQHDELMLQLNENEILELNHKSAVATKVNNNLLLWVLGLALFIIIVSVIILLQRNRQEEQFNKQLENQVYTKTKEISNKNAELNRINEGLNHFANIVSHDLKTYAKNINQLAAITNVTKQQVVNHKRLTENAQGLNQFVENITSYYLVDGRQAKVASCNLNEVIQTAKQNLNELIEEKQAQVVAESNMPTISFDERELVLVATKLIENGILFNHSATPVVSISAQQNDLAVNVYFKDNGLGVSTEYQSQIFELFNRGEHFALQSGNGFGLTIVKKIIAKYNGNIRVESLENQGSTFILSLPKEILS